MSREHIFGGGWTDDKVERVGRYLDAYLTALKKLNFRLMYVDAFAGTGQRDPVEGKMPLLGELFDTDEFELFAKGSARRALELDQLFDQYVFIEKTPKHFNALREIIAEYPDRADRVEVLNADANVEVKRICAETDWRRWRGVVFLDPYGAQVEWSTIEAIAKTGGIDLFYLFPAIAVNRMTVRDGNIPIEWELVLDKILPDDTWRTEFFIEATETNLFGEVIETRTKDANASKMEEYFRTRLKRIFAGVSDKSLAIHNSKNSCIYFLMFAAANKKGAPLALRIADHILRMKL